MSTKELKPAAYMYERLMHDYLGGWESHITTFDPRESQWAKPEDLRNVEPLYSADTIERLERERDEAGAQIVSAREECPLVRRQDYFGTPLPALVAAQVSELFGWQSRAENAESELTTLRARVATMEEALTRHHEDREYVIGWNDGFDHALTKIVALQFPTMLRKMWSGSEVQAWLDARVKEARAALTEEPAS
jgi:hypothetical protein